MLKHQRYLHTVNVVMIFLGPAEECYGIAGCYAQFKVPLSWELRVTVYPEFVEGSLTCAFETLLNR